MKKTSFLFAAAALALASCGDGDGNEMHYIEMLYPSSHAAVVMADQTSDSLVFASTDSWWLTSSADWCTFDPEYKHVENPYQGSWLSCKMFLTFTPNTTGQTRYAILSIDGGESRNGATYAQVPYLGITRPQRLVSSDLMTDSLYTLTLAAEAERDSVCFRTYSTWTLKTTAAEPWLTLSTAEGRADKHIVYLTMTANTTTAERRDTLVLVSNGVADSIPVVQQAPKKAAN